MSLNLRRLRYFVTVAEELHFTRAAERLKIAQPPLSQQIKQLEVELHTTLFRRTRRSVQLTREGELLLERARPLLARVQEIEELMLRSSAGEVGVLRVSYIASACYETIPSIVREYRQKFPDVALQLDEIGTGPQIDALLSNRVDIGVVRPPLHSEALTFVSLFDEQLLIVVPDTHRLAKRKRLAIRDLAAEPFVIQQRRLGPGLYDTVMGLCLNAGFSPNVVQETGDAQTILSLVAAELGVGLVPASVATLRRPGVVYAHVPISEAKLEVGLAYRADNDSVLVHQFRDIALSVVGPSAAEMLSVSAVDGRPARSEV